MISWILRNSATIIVCIILAAVIAAIIIGLIRKKKKGISSCGCGCANCQMNGACHRK